MRTTIDLPDDLYRSLKARAALSGVPLRELLQGFIEQGLRVGMPVPPTRMNRRGPPPVLIAPQGVPIPAVPPAELRRLEEAEDQAKQDRSDSN